MNHTVFHASSVPIFVNKFYLSTTLKNITLKIPSELKFPRFVVALSMWTTLFESSLTTVSIPKLIFTISFQITTNKLSIDFNSILCYWNSACII